MLHSPLTVATRRWLLSAGGGLLALAVLAAGLGARAAAPGQVDDRKDVPKKEKKDEKEKSKRPTPMLPDIEELLRKLPADLPPEQVEMIRRQLERTREQMRRMMEQGEEQMKRIVEQAQRQVPPRWAARFGRPDGRLGVLVTPPSPALADQLDLPRGRGLVVEQVVQDSAAAKAGLKAHDVLIEFNGKPVPSNPVEFARMIEDTRANTPVDAVVRRKGKDEKVKGITLPEMPSRPGRRPIPSFERTVPPKPVPPPKEGKEEGKERKAPGDLR